MHPLVGFALGLLSAGQLGLALQVDQLYQFPNATQWIENIAVRSNGQLLLTSVDGPRMYTLDPGAKNPNAQLVVQVPDITELGGIAEVAPDVFAVSGGILNSTDSAFVEGSAQVVTVDFNKRDCEGGAPTVKTVAKVLNTRLLNGLVALPKHPHIILSADSKDGRIFRANTITGHVDVAFQDDRFTPGPAPKLIPLGVNGLKIYRGYLYLTNSEQLFFARIKINDFGDRAGNLEILAHFTANPLRVPDDFSIAKDGTAYVATHLTSLVKITPDGKWSDLVGADSNVKLDSPTATALSKDEKMVYVVTGGGSNGKGGQVVAVRL